ncbi:MarR family winged helix-turn-helix transcriptional regulator [Streptosporangium carneum]|uniref:Transcriptional regulator n=1 Tax=Streptosporangium carneum TaxID=47481 RepID=A0A9W6MGN2_9ACTN|nr:MarR family transcriptional regulator [Streptosporangium carneum]GLK13959.1 transcriptional regulator [Streptosporangium carneum]
MSTGNQGQEAAGPSVDDGIRTLLLLMPRMVGRVKRIRVPEDLRSLSLAPRHLSLLAFLLFDGPMGVNELAARLEVAPATVSLMVGELSRKGILSRREDEADRRRTIVSISEAHRPAIDGWLARGATAWRRALEPLTAAQRQMFIDTLKAYEEGLGEERDGGDA